MQGKRIKMFNIKARFGVWEERRGEERGRKHSHQERLQSKRRKKRGGWREKELLFISAGGTRIQSLNKEGVSRQHITVPLQSTIGTAGVAAIEPAWADVCIGRYHRGAQPCS